MLHMSAVGIRELRQHASAVLRRVAGGETIDVTDRGRPVARIVPLQNGSLDQLVAEGRASAPDGDLLESLQTLHLPAQGSGKSPASALREMRDDER